MRTSTLAGIARLLYDSSMAPTSGTRVVGYVRVSTSDQAEHGVGLDAQCQAITDEADRRGWELVTICEDGGLSGKSTVKRKGLHAALALLENDQADALVVAKLDRLARSMVDFATLLERAAQRGWDLVVLDLAVDTTTPHGEFLAHVMAALAQWERRIIGQRTKEGLAVKRAQGVRLGRPPVLQDQLVKRIRRLHAAGQSLGAIARQLNADAVPTAQGGREWYPSTVKAVLHRVNA